MRSLLLLPLVLLGGCASLSRNISGDFSCPAPNGVCAPLGAIDARAVAAVGVAPATVGGELTVPDNGQARLFTASSPVAPPVRAGERTLKVVFPARVDPSGIYREQSIAYAVVERGRWVPSQAATTRAPTLDDIVAAAPARSVPPVAAVESRPQSGNATAGQVAAFNAAALSAAPLNVREAIAGLAAAPMASLSPAFPPPVAAAEPAARPTAAALRAARRGHRIGRAAPHASTVHTRALNEAQLTASLNRALADAPAPAAAVPGVSVADLAQNSGETLSPLDAERPQ